MAPSGKRKNKCSGCHLAIKVHSWGKHGKYCEGPPVVLPSSSALDHSSSPSPGMHCSEKSRPTKQLIAEADDLDSVSVDLDYLERKKQLLLAHKQRRLLEEEISQLELDLGDVSLSTKPHRSPHSLDNARDDISLGELRKMTALRTEVDEELQPLSAAFGITKAAQRELRNLHPLSQSGELHNACFDKCPPSLFKDKGPCCDEIAGALRGLFLHITGVEI